MRVLATDIPVRTTKRSNSDKPEKDLRKIEQDSRYLVDKELEYHEETKNVIHNLNNAVGIHTDQLQTISSKSEVYGKAHSLIKEYESQI